VIKQDKVLRYVLVGELRRDGLPLRAEINVVGYLARKPEGGQRA
jgi:hypothetical protein